MGAFASGPLLKVAGFIEGNAPQSDQPSEVHSWGCLPGFWYVTCFSMRVKFMLLCVFTGIVVLAGTQLGLAQPQLTITEFMAANGQGLMDEDRVFSDWIEICNTGTAIDLQGWALTDSTNTLGKWIFPSMNLGSGQYLVVFASGKNRTNASARLHTSFSLNADGEYLALVSPEGEVVSEYSPQYPRQKTDVSYGVWHGRPYYFSSPTPGAANTEGKNDFVADTKFSHDRGFYDQAFDLTISTATLGATIYYTTNGLAPATTNLNSAQVTRYSGPIHIAGTTVLRAAAFQDGYEPSNVDTHTYVFLDDVIRQSPTGAAPPDWPASWSPNTRDYGMDPDIVNNAAYLNTIKQDLKTIPSFSLVMDLNDLFGTKGIYSNAGQDGRAWERKGSVELVYPDGAQGFQVDCGVRIRGGFSRSSDNPKHAFRFFFREVYGDAKLRYPLFGDRGADNFDCIDLRTFQNYSWSFQGDSRGVFLRDQFSRDTQLEMGHHAERGEFYHLYINGQYWGLYNTCERPEASYAESYYGGDKEDYDVIKVSADNGYTVGATDGNMQAWTRLYNACKAGLTNDAAYEKILGNNPDGTRNPEYEVLVDVDNLIDYMLVILYGGNLDAPISQFLGENSPNNWFGIRNRTGQFGGFRFFVHDAEHTLLNVNENRIGPFPAGNSSVTASSPQWIWQKMWANAEFRMRCADRVHQHFFNGGILTPEAARARLLRRADEIDRAVVGESARWGDAKRSTPYTRDTWLGARNSILNGYIPGRSAIVLNQLRSKNLYPSVVAPTFGQHGGAVSANFGLILSAPSGTIFYTLDGSDPRLRGGAVSPSARTYSGAIPLTESIVAKARVLAGANWSALNEATFILRQTYTNLLVTEIMYHPPDDEDADGDEFEFIELKNANPFGIDVSGVCFTNGLRFVFPLGTRLEPGQFAVLVRNPSLFTTRHPGIPVAGVFTGNLANSGERLTLVRATGESLVSLTYGDLPPWPVAADGQGFSLVPQNPNANPDPDNPVHWRASSQPGGSPGADDPMPNIPAVQISEALTHADLPQLDAIELFNPGAEAADVSGWYLSDDRRVPGKFRLPAGTIIPARGFRVFTESDFNRQPGLDPGFNLSSHGEEVFLFSADSTGVLTGYADGFAFGAAANGVTFGRYTNSVGELQFPSQIQPTLGGSNAGPRIGPVVINEIHYQPPPGEEEFIELKNLTDQPVPLFDPAFPTNTWRIDGAGFAFPLNAVIPANGLTVVVAGDPELFRSRQGIPAAVPVFGLLSGTLQNSGELLELQRPDSPDLVTNTLGETSLYVPYITVDAVRFNDKTPWPTNAAGKGPSLERLRPGAYGNDPASWRASFGIPSAGLDNDGNRRPTVNAGTDQQFESAVFPLPISLKGSGSDDGLPNGNTLRYQWSQLDGFGRVLFVSVSQAETLAYLPGAGEYVLRLTGTDGELSASDEVAVNISRPTGVQTIVAAGSEWRYLDDGSDQGVAWRTNAFNDSGWKQGRAQLGYGDGDEQTTVGFGPDTGNRYVTTYFRKRFQVADPSSITAATLRVLRDDGVAVYLNGREIARDNMPEGGFGYTSYASGVVSGSEESTLFIERTVDPSGFRLGENVIAAEVHQANAGSTDVSFDLVLEINSFPIDRPPTVNAGPDIAIRLPGAARLQGGVSDDGLPLPPGVVACDWSKISGPGEITFADPNAWITTASFDRAGEYVLRLTANDGASVVTDEVNVTVTGMVEFHLGAIELITGESLALRFTFTAEASVKYVLQGRDSLAEGNWQWIRDFMAPPTAQPMEVTVPIDPSREGQFFRILVE
jgi:hypothetical protein